MPAMAKGFCKNNIATVKRVPGLLKPFLYLSILLSNNEGYLNQPNA